MNFFQLPRRLWWSHHFAFLLHDFLADVFARGEREGLFHMRFPFADEAEAASLDATGEGELLDWLYKTGRTQIAEGVIERSLVHAILSDMCHFLFESIECMAKGKVSVAYALLRKPLRDELFALEWILVDPRGYYEEFRKGPEAVDICDLLTKQRDFTERTAKAAIDLSHYRAFVDFDLVWGLRFDKAAEWGLERNWNQAIHLVTTCKHYRTSTEGLNYLFLEEEEQADLVDEYYRRVPMVLLHACGVVRSLIDRWNSGFAFSPNVFDMRMTANAELWLVETSEQVVSRFARDTVNGVLNDIELACEGCRAPLQMARDQDLEDLSRDGVVRCGQCGALDSQLLDIDGIDTDESEFDE